MYRAHAKPCMNNCYQLEGLSFPAQKLTQTVTGMPRMPGNLEIRDTHASNMQSNRYINTLVSLVYASHLLQEISRTGDQWSFSPTVQARRAKGLCARHPSVARPTRYSANRSARFICCIVFSSSVVSQVHTNRYHFQTYGIIIILQLTSGCNQRIDGGIVPITTA